MLATHTHVGASTAACLILHQRNLARDHVVAFCHSQASSRGRLWENRLAKILAKTVEVLGLEMIREWKNVILST